MTGEEPLQILLLCDFDPFQAQMVQDHVHGLTRLSRHTVHVLSFRRRLPDALDLSRFDAIVIHYSLFIYEESYLDSMSRARIAAFPGIRAVFVQDEYKHVERTRAALAALRTDIVFTCLPEASVDQVYRVDGALDGVRFVQVLTGYVTAAMRALRPGPPPSARPIDIGYRGRRYPAWHGQLGKERTLLAAKVGQAAQDAGLKTDISVEERDRIYGPAWFDFMQACRTVLGSESGASVFDFTGEIAARVEAHERRDPNATYELLRDLYFADQEGRIAIAQISPRIFEALAAGCALVLMRGDYSGRLVAGRHYLPIEKDLSNVADVMRSVRDGSFLDCLAARARADVLEAPENQEEAFVALFDDVLAERFAGHARTRTGYGPQEFIARFGLYSSRWTSSALKRRTFGLAYGAYSVLVRHLPGHLEVAIRLRLKKVLRAMRG